MLVKVNSSHLVTFEHLIALTFASMSVNSLYRSLDGLGNYISSGKKNILIIEGKSGLHFVDFKARHTIVIKSELLHHQRAVDSHQPINSSP